MRSFVRSVLQGETLGVSIGKIMRELAVEVFTGIGCAGMARVDFFLRGDDEIWLNEINTIPGYLPQRNDRGMGEFFLPNVPFLNIIMHRMGSVVGTPKNCIDLLENARGRIAVLDRGKLEIVATPDEFFGVTTPVARAFLDTLPVEMWERRKM